MICWPGRKTGGAAPSGSGALDHTWPPESPPATVIANRHGDICQDDSRRHCPATKSRRDLRSVLRSGRVVLTTQHRPDATKQPGEHEQTDGEMRPTSTTPGHC